jgi:hypothetical protein
MRRRSVHRATEADLAVLALVRLAERPEVPVSCAAERLRRQVPNETTVRWAGSRVARSMAERPSAIGERCLEIVREVLAAPAPPSAWRAPPVGRAGVGS